MFEYSGILSGRTEKQERYVHLLDTSFSSTNTDNIPYQWHDVVCGNAAKQMFNESFLKNTTKTHTFQQAYPGTITLCNKLTNLQQICPNDIILQHLILKIRAFND